MKSEIYELIEKDKEFKLIIDELINNETVKQMKNYIQHYETTCFDHCYTVSYYCYLICKKYHLDYKSAARAGMLHDLFLYDWRKKQPNREGMHAFTHGRIACDNANKLFELNNKEQNMILTHMWPVTIEFPKSFEGFILTFVDKYCAMSESFEVLKLNLFSKKSFRYAYLFTSFFSFRICI